jgi:hypothetical protein
MTNSKNPEFELGLKAIGLALALNDLLDESAHEGAAQIAAMSDLEIDRLIARSERSPANRERPSRFGTPIWQGLLDALVPMKPVAIGALAGEHSSARRAGVMIEMRQVLGDEFDIEDFAWASGSLRLEAVYSDAETILSLRISVSLRKPFRETGQPLLVEFTDLAQGHEAVRLSIGTPSVTLSRPKLSGALEGWTLTVSAAEHSSL